jgi:hypothetical protein
MNRRRWATFLGGVCAVVIGLDHAKADPDNEWILISSRQAPSPISHADLTAAVVQQGVVILMDIDYPDVDGNAVLVQASPAELAAILQDPRIAAYDNLKITPEGSGSTGGTGGNGPVPSGPTTDWAISFLMNSLTLA